jgi:hypothetical protein
MSTALMSGRRVSYAQRLINPGRGGPESHCERRRARLLFFYTSLRTRREPKRNAQTANDEISRSNSQFAMVYELYDLTPDEIAIVENQSE